MSPTYWTSSRIINAGKLFGWKFVSVGSWEPDPDAWGARKEHYSVMFREDRRGGLTWVQFCYPVSGGTNCDTLGQHYRGKLAEVLAFLEDPTCRGGL